MQGSIAILVTRDVRESYRDVNGNQIDKLLSEIVKIKTQTIVYVSFIVINSVYVNVNKIKVRLMELMIC